MSTNFSLISNFPHLAPFNDKKSPLNQNFVTANKISIRFITSL